MHDPMVVVFDVPLPIPRRRGWDNARDGEARWSIKRRLYSKHAVDNNNAPSALASKPMDPWWRPRAYRIRVAGRSLQWVELCTVWHVEPDGHDSGTICKGMRGSQLTAHNVRWAWKHRRHLEVHFGFTRKVKRWLRDRCAECGDRFRWKQSRRSYMSTDKVWHDKCMSLRHVRGQLDDALACLAFDADDTTRWRVERQLDRRSEKAKETA